MVHDIDLWELDSPLADSESPPNVIVISNDFNTQGDISFTRCLRSMHNRHYSAFIVQPKDITQENLKTQDWPRWILDQIVSFSQIRYLVSDKKWRKKKKIKKHVAVKKPEVSRVKTHDSPPVKTMVRQDLDLFCKISLSISTLIQVYFSFRNCFMPSLADPIHLSQGLGSASSGTSMIPHSLVILILTVSIRESTWL